MGSFGFIYRNPRCLFSSAAAWNGPKKRAFDPKPQFCTQVNYRATSTKPENIGLKKPVSRSTKPWFLLTELRYSLDLLHCIYKRKVCNWYNARQSWACYIAKRISWELFGSDVISYSWPQPQTQPGVWAGKLEYEPRAGTFPNSKKNVRNISELPTARSEQHLHWLGVLIVALSSTRAAYFAGHNALPVPSFYHTATTCCVLGPRKHLCQLLSKQEYRPTIMNSIYLDNAAHIQG